MQMQQLQPPVLKQCCMISSRCPASAHVLVYLCVYGRIAVHNTTVPQPLLLAPSTSLAASTSAPPPTANSTGAATGLRLLLLGTAAFENGDVAAVPAAVDAAAAAGLSKTPGLGDCRPGESMPG